MLANKPPMGWNSWNTFGKDISESLIFTVADAMVEKGYLAAGYEYLVIDDCWSEMERDENGRLVPDHNKFPHGMKAVADYVHAKGLKFGMYSCAGVRTCAGYPASFDHEYEDARTFASWGVDFLKYDFCNFPENGDCKTRYLTMAMALRASGRDILFSACNWGREEPWLWMRSVGAHMYRSTGDILDNFISFTNIATAQAPNFAMSAPGCYNDVDMLTVGMYGKGNVGLGAPCNDAEYRMQFSLWCLLGAPLMMGGDIRNLSPESESLLKNPALIAIDQDEEGRPPYLAGKAQIFEMIENVEGDTEPFRFVKDKAYVYLKHLSNNEFVLAYVNLHSNAAELQCIFSDIGLPYSSGCAVEMEDVFSGEKLGQKRDYYHCKVPAHDCRLFRCRAVRV